ncbi:unnamed protein product [Pleuronectes platessa]|uniref:Uncharacterized protein n=1 Tax=Pleuronectes platessa TaxID=8262 RepID=A0A9N7Y7R1_PLEPL|nr:unnamed protein product [Pleuronectes platessa]
MCQAAKHIQLCQVTSARRCFKNVRGGVAWGGVRHCPPTSDHGAGPTPEVLLLLRVPRANVPGSELSVPLSSIMRSLSQRVEAVEELLPGPSTRVVQGQRLLPGTPIRSEQSREALRLSGVMSEDEAEGRTGGGF